MSGFITRRILTAPAWSGRATWAMLEDQKLLRYYPDRTVLLLEPDARPPRLTPYRPDAAKTT